MLIGVMPEARTPRTAEFRPRPETIREMVTRLALDTKNIAWSVHAFERMHERGITDHVAVEVLRKGWPKGPIEPGDKPGEWKVKMVREVRGRREVGVVVITISDRRLFVKTAEWEDVT
jgi:hypothetical protein